VTAAGRGDGGSATDLEEVRRLAYALLRREPESREAHLRLYEIEQMLGRPDAAVAHLRRALAASRIITFPARVERSALTVLALYRVASWEANLPFELVVDEGRTTVHRLYIDDADTERTFDGFELPPHDVVLNAIAESDRARPALWAAERLAERSRVPVINRPSQVVELGRERVARRFARAADVLAPAVERVTFAQLAARPVTTPLVVRPVGSQAGVDLDKIDDAGALRAYLTAHPHERYFVMPFVDYRSPDGLYRKYRIMFVNGTPFAYHLAISPRWMIHYYNAAMQDNAWMRAEEAHFLENFDGVFSGRLAAAVGEIAAGVPLTYFGIDCGIAPDGRLLLFEADAAMLVHGTDDPDLYGYKRAAFGRVQAALAQAIEGIAARTVLVR
jgi:hypothetical protein